MNKKLKKILVSTLCLAMTTSFFGCDSQAEVPVSLPDYWSNGKQFEYFTYISPTNGYYTIDGFEYFTEDFRTVERYKEMLECGFNVLYINRDAAYYEDTVWETSETKKCFENAYAAGFKKIILTDYRINSIIDTGSTVFDPAKAESDPNYDADPTHYTYASEADLDAVIKEYMQVYASMPGFYGLVLLDEPNYKKAEAMGHVYRSVKRVATELGVEDLFIHSNYLPVGATSTNYGVGCKEVHAEGETCPTEYSYHNHKEMYRNYLERFIQETGMERISADSYAFRGYGLYHGFYSSIQVLADLVKKYDIDMSYCLQSWHQYKAGEETFRKVDKSMMYMEMNSLVGFGASKLAYYVYMPHVSASSSQNSDTGDGSFLTRDGERTNIWYNGQTLMREMQEFAPVVLSYDYQGAKFYRNQISKFGTNYHLSSFTESVTNTTLDWDNSYEFEILKDVKLDNDIALVTELKDSENDLYMYMVQNVIDPDKSTLGDTSMNVEADFGAEYSYVAEFDCGQLRYVPLENGVYKNTLSAGYAVYLIPLK